MANRYPPSTLAVQTGQDCSVHFRRNSRFSNSAVPPLALRGWNELTGRSRLAKPRLLAGLLVSLLAFTLTAQAQTPLWQHSYRSGFAGETANNYAGSLKLSPNLYVHAGVVNTSGGYYPYFLYTNAQGDSLRTQVLPARNGNIFYVASNLDGTFTWGGTNKLGGPGTTQRHTLAKLNQQGQVLWQTDFHGLDAVGRQTSLGMGGLVRTPDGYMVAANTVFYTTPTGSTRLNRQTLDLFDNQGQLVWERTFPGDASTADLRLQPNGAYVAAGFVGVRTPLTTSAYFSLDWRLVEFTHSGDTVRTKRFGIEGDFDNALRLIPTTDKGLAVLTEYEPRVTTNPNPYVLRLVKLDSLWNVQWTVTLPQTANVTDLRQTRAGDILLGASAGPLNAPQALVLRYSATGQPHPTLGPYALPNARQLIPGRLMHEPGDSLMLWGSAQQFNSPARTTYTQRFYGVGIGGSGAAGVGAPFVPDYCRYPPRPNLGVVPPPAAYPDSLVLVDFSTAGPRYAQNVRFRWDLGNGTVRDTYAAGPFRYRYAQVPPAGTPVTVTVWNNLGCAATQTLYPFGRPTSAQQARAWAAQASLFPNPTSGTATLRLPPDGPAGPVAVDVLDALGRVLPCPVPRPGADPHTLLLDLGALPAGVYAVRVRTDTGSFSKRLVRY
ncbi:T9SS type A sorting domain-containing protein [Hymenobacter rubidus]|uniref:T9SS type A sorting domain-containing protein n=1 Tax=Hymenobacter rubidus TaxID=1441626 RepID=UPI00191F0122|nr:T9SS type A sorting domain-containing protein [Hymenobacter rubidus]